MKSTFKRVIPMLDRVLIKRAESLRMSKGGIAIPEKATENSAYGVVIAVGPGNLDTSTGKRIPVNLKEGDQVLLPKYGGTKVDMEDDKEYVLFREQDIIAKVEQ